ncbi:hypothetical protein HMPREF9554_02325 [Treponema phagedenis F0421]|nr:hypothetical protein HMPREF9554_02325 [Treponema phagedenis F0421]
MQNTVVLLIKLKAKHDSTQTHSVLDRLLGFFTSSRYHILYVQTIIFIKTEYLP